MKVCEGRRRRANGGDMQVCEWGVWMERWRGRGSHKYAAMRNAPVGCVGGHICMCEGGWRAGGVRAPCGGG